MLIIRLQRKGKINKAYFNIVVTEHTVAAKGKYHELLGSYDPHLKSLNVKKDRIEYWISKGAQLSATIRNLFISKDIIKGEKVTSWKPKKKPDSDKKAETPKTEKPKAEANKDSQDKEVVDEKPSDTETQTATQ